MSLYQKYRAKSFSQILTQEHVTSTIQSSIKSSSFGHAYVFVGTRGTGKTSVARIFARAVNCQNESSVTQNGEPCNECESCILSLNGGNIDIIEMDAASNRGIEEVRNLKEGVDFLPSIGKYKVYIIDEAHMMTKEAFNALLKTIEEPPKHVMFIMCTTEIFKLPATIISRSQVFELKHASIPQIISKIDLILENENVNIDSEGKKLIAKLGRGSFRDTESILEKVIGIKSDDIISYEEVVSALGLSSIVLIENTKRLFYEKDLNKLRLVLDNEVDEGVITNFNQQLCESIYEDIIADLEKNETDPFKYELFDFLTSIDKDLRNAINLKLLYVAKSLNFLKTFNFKNHLVISNSAPMTQAINLTEHATSQVEVEEEKLPPKDISTNPSALLRHRRDLEQKSKPVQHEEQQIENPQKKEKFISKIDFLDFMKSNNAFLLRFFSHHEFQIEGNELTVDVTKQMEKDLLSKSQTINLIKKFGDLHGIDLKMVFGEVNLDKRKKEERIVSTIQKKVEDLDEKEINEIFKSKTLN